MCKINNKMNLFRLRIEFSVLFLHILMEEGIQMNNYILSDSQILYIHQRNDFLSLHNGMLSLYITYVRIWAYSNFCKSICNHDLYSKYDTNL